VYLSQNGEHGRELQVGEDVGSLLPRQAPQARLHAPAQLTQPALSHLSCKGSLVTFLYHHKLRIPSKHGAQCRMNNEFDPNFEDLKSDGWSAKDFLMELIKNTLKYASKD